MKTTLVSAGSCETAGEPEATGGAEVAGEAAADLGRDTDCAPVAFGQVDRFDDRSVGKPECELDRAIFGRQRRGDRHKRTVSRGPGRDYRRRDTIRIVGQ